MNTTITIIFRAVGVSIPAILCVAGVYYIQKHKHYQRPPLECAIRKDAELDNAPDGISLTPLTPLTPNPPPMEIPRYYRCLQWGLDPSNSVVVCGPVEWIRAQCHQQATLYNPIDGKCYMFTPGSTHEMKEMTCPKN